MRGMSDYVVVEVSRRGRLVLGEPYFTPGVPLPLDKNGLGDVGEGDLAVVATRRGRARLERALGPADRIENVLEGLLEHEGLRREFRPFDLPAPSFEGRTDLRDLITFTIDPETAKDFDDAISARREGDGVRVWVHIADVSWFVRAGSPLDHGAAERALSVYVPGLVAPMLPHELADDACSLRPNVDRLSVTVEVPFDAALEAGEPTFYRSVTRSDARLTYGQAERILRGNEKAAAELVEALQLAERVALHLRQRRFTRGALRIAAAEIAIKFDGEGGVERAYLETEPHAHALIEELMILANEAVAELLSSRRRGALFRVHERPDPQSITRLLTKLADLDVPTPAAPETDRMSPSDAARIAAEASERVSEYVERAGRGREAFPALVLRSLKQARYHPQNLGHAGLASTAYCHFTSPIRRYPDLVVHRALLHELGQGDDPVPEDLDDSAEHCSLQEREAAQIEYHADDICLAWLLEEVLFERGWETVFPGEITGLIGSGLFVRFGDVFEGFLPVRRLPGYYEINELETALVGRRGGSIYRLGEPIEVTVEEIRRTEGKVELRQAE
jgi:ribonuclease R